MRDSKKLESFLKEKEIENKQQSLFTNLRKEVEIGANGTQKYVIKKGTNKGKIADVKRHDWIWYKNKRQFFF